MELTSARALATGHLGKLWRDEDATTSLEYALMLAIIATSAVVGYKQLGLAVADGAAEGSGGVETAATAPANEAAGSGGGAPCPAGAAAPG